MGCKIGSLKVTFFGCRFDYLKKPKPRPRYKTRMGESKAEIATRESVRKRENLALSCSLVQVHRIGYSHHIVYLVYTLSSLAAGG